MSKLFYGNINECIYTGHLGNLMGAPHDKIYKQDVFLVEVEQDTFIELDELLSNKKKKVKLNTSASKVGELFVDKYSLVNVSDVMLEKTEQKTK